MLRLRLPVEDTLEQKCWNITKTQISLKWDFKV